MVQIFTSGLAPAAGVATDPSNLLTTQRASGSGVIVDAEGYIVTNAHVVSGASRIRVELPIAPTGQSLLARRSRVVPARLIGIDEETDIAVLRVEERGLPALPFGDSDELRAGQMVLAFGSPLGLQNSVSLGIVTRSGAATRGGIADGLHPDRRRRSISGTAAGRSSTPGAAWSE